MAKDPAFLFYTGDFSTGTQFFTDEQVGKYIRLLMAQHQLGHLQEKDMLKICKTYDKDIFSKFVKDSDGLFFNERLEEEVVKRKKYSQSRSENRSSKNDISSTYVLHMENENIKGIKEGVETIKGNLETFDAFRKKYRALGGIVRGNQTEFETFKKHKDWKEVLPNLNQVIENVKVRRAKLEQQKKTDPKSVFIAPMKNLKTWLFQRCWEEDQVIPESVNGQIVEARINPNGNDYAIDPQSYIHGKPLPRPEGWELKLPESK